MIVFEGDAGQTLKNENDRRGKEKKWENCTINGIKQLKTHLSWFASEFVGVGGNANDMPL